MKRFAPPPVRLQIEKQLASQACASNTEKVWQLIGNLATPDIKILVHCVSFIHYNGFFQCGYVNIQEDNSLLVITDCVHEFKRESSIISLHL